MADIPSSRPIPHTDAQHPVPEPTLELSNVMAPRRPIPAGIISLLVHGCLAGILTTTMRMVPQGAALEPDRTSGIVLVHEQQGKREYFDPQATLIDGDAAAPAGMAAALPKQSEIPVDVTSSLPGPQAMPPGLADSILQATQVTGQGNPARRGGTGTGTSTEVFGVSGRGSKFVYVFDRSGSMDGYRGRPLRAAQIELTESLRDLKETHQFQIIFYNETPRIFEPRPGAKPQLAFADETTVHLAKAFVRGIQATGGTRHLTALETALGMYPDVVFFLTDADEPQLSPRELEQVQRWNRGTVIHAIEFGFGPQTRKDNFLVKLARQNGGQHAYVDISLLRDSP